MISPLSSALREIEKELNCSTLPNDVSIFVLGFQIYYEITIKTGTSLTSYGDLEERRGKCFYFLR